MEPAKAYSYVRFSTPEQALGDSQRRQAEAALAWAVQNGMALDDTLNIADPGISAYRGKNARIGGLGRFLEATRDGLVPEGSFLVVESLDRVSRDDAYDALRLIQDICDAGVTIVTLQDGAIYSDAVLRKEPMRLFGGLMVMIRANEESATKSRRLGAVWKQKRKVAGVKRLTSICPAWLTPSADGKGFDVVEDRAAIVKRIFAETLKGLGSNRITLGLNRDGVATFGDADMWHRSYVQKILLNSAVIGTLTPHTLEYPKDKRTRVPQEPLKGYYPAVVPASVFHRVAAQRVGGRAPKDSVALPGISNLLAGLARCPACEGTMTRVQKGSRSRPSYVCVKAKAGAGCAYRSVPEVHVEGALRDQLASLIAEPAKASVPVNERVAALQAELTEADKAIANLVAATIAQPSVALSAALANVEAARAKAQSELRAMATVQDALGDARTRGRRVADLQAAFQADPLDRPKVNAILRQCFDWVTVDYRIGWLVFGWKGGGVSTSPYAATKETPAVA